VVAGYAGNFPLFPVVTFWNTACVRFVACIFLM